MFPDRVGRVILDGVVDADNYGSCSRIPFFLFQTVSGVARRNSSHSRVKLNTLNSFQKKKY